MLGGAGSTAPAAKINTNLTPEQQAQMNAGYVSQDTAQGRMGDVYGQQQGLANALLNQSQGIGPNPAQAQYQQNVNQMAQQQAGAIAGTKGINPALAARLIQNQGAQAQQQAAGQQATLQAQQQIAAQQALGQQQMNMGNLAATGGAQGLSRASTAGGLGNQQIANEIARSGVGAQEKSTQNSLIGGLLQAGGTVVGSIYGGPAGGAAGGAVGAAAANTIDKKAKGGEIDGEAKVAGDSEKNDTVPTMLSPGEVVLPRSVTQSDDPVGKAAKFVAELKAHKEGPKGYSQVLEARKHLQNALKALGEK